MVPGPLAPFTSSPIVTLPILQGRWGLLRWLSEKESNCQCRRCGFNPWVGEILWSRKRQPPPVFLPGESHGLQSVGLQKMTYRLNNKRDGGAEPLPRPYVSLSHSQPQESAPFFQLVGCQGSAHSLSHYSFPGKF